MTNASDIYGSVYERGSAVLLARVARVDWQPIQSSDLASITYSVSGFDRCTNQYQPVAGHSAVSLAIGDVIYDTLQTGPPWDVDDTGYNFRHEIDVTSDEAFPVAGTIYQARYEMSPVSGQKIVFRYQLQAI